MWRFTQPRSRPVGCETSHQQIWVDCGLDENWSVGWVVGWVRGGERCGGLHNPDLCLLVVKPLDENWMRIG